MATVPIAPPQLQNVAKANSTVTGLVPAGQFNAVAPPIRTVYDTGPLKGNSVPGMLDVGNIDLNQRPSIKNADGTSSSIFSMTVPIGKEGQPLEWGHKDITGYALVPSIADGKFLTKDGKMPDQSNKKAMQALEDEATKYYTKTKQHLGIFKTMQDANSYAARTHAYGPKGPTKDKVYAPSY